MSMIDQQPVLRVENLKTELRTARGRVRAVDDVSFDLRRGETLGLVGESGSGKTLTCMSILRLLPDRIGEIVGGRVVMDGVDLATLSEEGMRAYRGKSISVILQDPMTSLNPVLSIGDQVGEGVSRYLRLKGRELRAMVVELLRKMRIPAPDSRVSSYPHEMSGGMRQRVGGAMAISGEPAVLIADEPTTALDATVQAQFLALLRDIQRQRGLSILFVTHDFGIVANMCDRVAVMYAGRIVEIADVTDLFERPLHPYTEALLRSVPDIDVDVDRLYSIEGQPPALHELPVGCAFAPRCPSVHDRCRAERPPMFDARANQRAACWRWSPHD